MNLDRMNRDAHKVTAVINSCVNTDQLRVACNMLHQYEKLYLFKQENKHDRMAGVFVCEKLNDVYFEKLWDIRDCTLVAQLDERDTTNVGDVGSNPV